MQRQRHRILYEKLPRLGSRPQQTLKHILQHYSYREALCLRTYSYEYSSGVRIRYGQVRYSYSSQILLYWLLLSRVRMSERVSRFATRYGCTVVMPSPRIS